MTRTSACAFLAVVLFASAAAADDVATATETFRTGTAAYARGDYKAAALSFELSHKMAPHAVALYNAGLAWEASGDAPRAADDYDSALGRDQLDDRQRADAKKRLTALRATLGRLRITAPAGAVVSVRHVERASAPLRVHLTPGSHEVRVVYADGRDEVRPIDVQAGAEVPIELQEPAASVTSAPAGKPRAAQPGGADRAQPASGGSLRKTLGFVAAGVGVAAVGTGVALGFVAVGARDDFEASGRHDADAHDRAATMRTLANIGLFAGGALVVGGVVLVLTAPKESAAPTAALFVGPSSGGVRGSF